MIIFLIGYRGSGKTAVGQSLADRLGCLCFDSDLEIERRSNKTIAALFAGGDVAFRKLEHDTICGLVARVGGSADSPVEAVISLGGGAVLDGSTRQLMRRHGLTVWLQADADTLYRRVASCNPAHRPRLTNLPLEQEIRQVLAEREPVYAECADYRIDTAPLNPDQVAEQIAQWLATVDNRSDA